MDGHRTMLLHYPMPKWRRRALLYQVIGAIPYSSQVLNSVRNRFGRLKNWDLTGRQPAINEMIYILNQVKKSVEDKTLAEIGAGWHPYMAALFYGMGAKKIFLTDVAANIRPEYVLQTLQYLIDNVGKISERSGVSESQLLERWNELNPDSEPWRVDWKKKGIIYLAPFNFADTKWANESVDMIYSNSCLGYVPESVLTGIFSESARVLRPGGWVSHNITTYDDYSIYDLDVSPLNFLTFSQNEWQRIGNSNLHYQNRLRPENYLTLCRDAKMTVSFSERKALCYNLEIQERISLDEQYSTLPDEEILCARFLLSADKL